MGTIREFTKKDGTKTFHAEVRLKNYPEQRATFRTQTQAKKWIRQTEQEIIQGKYFKKLEASKHTVGEMIDKFIAEWLPKNSKSQKKQEALLLWWKATCGHIILSDFSPAVIAECRDHLLKQQTSRKAPRSPSTVNRYLSAIGKVLNIAMKEWGWIDDTPISKVSKPPEGKARDRLLTLDERDRLLEECKQSRNPHLYPMVAISLMTGMRYSELANLKWEEIDLTTNLITLRETKNGETRYVPLSSEAKSILEQTLSYQQGYRTGKLFKAVTDATNTISVRSAFDNALKRAAIHNFRWQDLRHAAASYLAMNGATQGELMAILGHKSPSMTRRYAHYSQQHLFNLLERTNSKIHSTNEV